MVILIRFAVPPAVPLVRPMVSPCAKLVFWSVALQVAPRNPATALVLLQATPPLAAVANAPLRRLVSGDPVRRSQITLGVPASAVTCTSCTLPARGMV